MRWKMKYLHKFQRLDHERELTYRERHDHSLFRWFKMLYNNKVWVRRLSFVNRKKCNDLEYAYFVMLCVATPNLFSNFKTCPWKWIKISWTPRSIALSMSLDVVLEKFWKQSFNFVIQKKKLNYLEYVYFVILCAGTCCMMLYKKKV